MSQRAQTADERFLLKVYQTALENGDPLLPVDYHKVARAIGQKETAIKNIIKHLAQANFVIKVDAIRLHLTQHGCNFVLNHLF